MSLPLNNFVRVKILDLVRGVDQYSVFKQYQLNQFEYSREQIEEYQKRKLNEIFQHHFQRNPRYREYVTNAGFKGGDIVNSSDIPLIDKEYFRSNMEDNYLKQHVGITKHSGGSTGVPLTVHLSNESIQNFWPSIWRAFDVYGIRPCDKMLMIAGPSLFNNRSFKRKIYDLVNRFSVVSAYDLSNDVLEDAYRLILREKIKAIYGYTSSILIFLRYLEKNKKKLDLKCIFTTSETFIPSVIELAKEYCNCDVIDTYGANDGGVQSFECEYHEGYHLNFERCLVEIVDNEIILTDLLNTASPFIRYKVGDYTMSDKLIKERCKCGRSLFRLKSISGKVNQFIEDLDGVKIHCGFFTQLFKSDPSVKQYQIVNLKDALEINIVYDTPLDEELFIEKYQDAINRRFKIKHHFVFNQPIRTLTNMKTPILWKEE